MRTRRRATLALTAALLCLAPLSAGCGTDPDRQEQQTVDYRPVPDQRLYSRITDLPGVTDVDVSYDEGSFGQSSGYTGRIAAESGADALDILDRSIAILWQGKPGVIVGVRVVVPDEPAYNARMLDLIAGRDFIDRYGEHPGDGTPPS